MNFNSSRSNRKIKFDKKWILVVFIIVLLLIVFTVQIPVNIMFAFITKIVCIAAIATIVCSILLLKETKKQEKQICMKCKYFKVENKSCLFSLFPEVNTNPANTCEHWERT